VAEPRIARRERPPAEQAKVAQLFQAPQFTGMKPDESRREGAGDTPKIELRGFAGKLRAIVAVNGEIVVVEQGDLINGVQVVAIDGEEKSVSFQYGGNRWTPRLFEKPVSQGVVLARADTAATSVPGATAEGSHADQPAERN
jgi:hypothetical protein